MLLHTGILISIISDESIELTQNVLTNGNFFRTPSYVTFNLGEFHRLTFGVQEIFLNLFVTNLAERKI